MVAKANKYKIGERKVLDPFVNPNSLTEKFKGEVELNIVKFPKELGEEHPFDFKLCEDAYKKHGFVKAAVDKHLDFMMSTGFHVSTKDEKAKILINSLIENTNFELILREWIQEGLIKGNGFLEVAVDRAGVELKVVNANNMYIKRDKTGKVELYNQYVGGFNKFNFSKVIPFNPEEIAHIGLSKVGDDAYGQGMVCSAIYTLNNLSRSEKDMHILISRKANAPIHAKLGTTEEPATAADVDAFGTKLIYLQNQHEWATDHRVEFKVIDFGNLAEKFATVMEHDKEMLYCIFQVPAELMGIANIPEGLAKARLNSFDRRIQSIQANIEQVIEERIFKPYLKANGLDAHVEIEWNLPSEETINNRVNQLTTLIGSAMVSPELRALLEKDVAQQLGFEEKDIDLLPSPQDARQEKEDNQSMQFGAQPSNKNPENKERKKEESIKQPEIPGEKPSAKEMKILIENLNEYAELSLKEFVNIKELAGFNYDDYQQAILKILKVDKFEDLRAKSDEDIQNGLLDRAQLESLRTALKEGFEKNKTIKEIEKDIRDNVKLKDRIQDNQVILGAELRPNMIARTETVRLANEGLVDLYKENDIKEVRWLAAVSDRTCPICLSLDGRIFKLNEMMVGINQPPKHPNCRCSLVGII